jgi:hypothetical protein
MSQDILVRQGTIRDVARPFTASAGPDRAAGSAPPPPSPEVGPANPRLRVDRELGVLVVEFRDMTGEVTMSMPSPRELEAYRAAIMYGLDLPSYMSPNGQSAESIMKTRPGLPPMEDAPAPLWAWLSPNKAESSGVDRVA